MDALYIAAYLIGYAYAAPRAFRWWVKVDGELTDRFDVLWVVFLSLFTAMFWPLFPIIKLFDMFILTPFANRMLKKDWQ